MAKEDWPEAEFGPHIPFREHSFLDNPAAPASITAGKVVVAPCEGTTTRGAGEAGGCGDGSGPALVASGGVKLVAGMDSERIKT
jgi:hypothetical protein